MNQPEKPKPQPETPTVSPTVSPKDNPGGVPDGAGEDDAKGLPESGREESETAGKR